MKHIYWIPLVFLFLITTPKFTALSGAMTVVVFILAVFALPFLWAAADEFSEWVNKKLKE